VHALAVHESPRMTNQIPYFGSLYQTPEGETTANGRQSEQSLLIDVAQLPRIGPGPDTEA